MHQTSNVKRSVHPREISNVFSLVSFFYTISLFTKGCKRSLETSDLYEVVKSCRAKQLGDVLENQWETEKSRHKTPSICRTAWVCYGRSFMVLGVLKLILKLMNTIFLPEAFSKLIAYFSPGQTDLTHANAIHYACAVIGLNLFYLFLNNNLMVAFIELGIKVRVAVASLLYRKSLKLSCETLSDVTLGKITTIITKDIDPVELFIEFGNDIWIALVQTGVICYLVYNKIGFASFAGITFFIIILPLQIFIGKLAYNFRLATSKKTDERLELIQEVLSAIKIIKMYTWEKFFVRKINATRKLELRKLHKLFYAKVWIVVIGSICSKIAFFFVLMAYIWTGNNVTAEIVYYILSCFNDLEFSLNTLIPFGVSYAAEAFAAARRIESVLCAQEVPKPQSKPLQCDSPEIVFKEVTVIISQIKILESITLRLTEGLHIVVGDTGSGKTTFLKAILQECRISGDLKLSGTISFASQEAWLFPASIRNNIIFGEVFCETRYKQVLNVCCLEYDLDLLIEGDMTDVGDRGVNLSGGQKARINLARAVYKESDVYLFDDCLSSLDGHVADAIFKNCIRAFLKHKLCILVTNNLDYRNNSDAVISINNGTVRLLKQSFINDVENSATDDTDKRIAATDSQKKIYNEDKKSGAVSLSDYYRYIVYGGGAVAFCLVMTLFLATQTASSFAEKLMSTWVTLEQNLSTKANGTKETEYEELYQRKTYALNLYIVVSVTSVLLPLARAFAFFNFTRLASVSMHQAMVSNIVNSVMHFFDTHFIGSIMNRFSKDYLILDEMFPFALFDYLSMIFVICGGVILLTTINMIFLIEVFILFLAACFLKIVYQPTGRDLNRLNFITRNPMIGYLNSSLEGLSTIRASQAQKVIAYEFDSHQDIYTSANYTLNLSTTALEFALDLVCTAFTAVVMLQFLLTDLNVSVGEVGLAITQAFTITSIITTGVKNTARYENMMTATERILEFTRMKEEGQDGELLLDWPKDGSINFNNVSLSYGNPAEVILNDVSFVIKPRQTIGIVGRTGAGKSTIVSALLRLYPIKGNIYVDGVDISSVSLKCLRSNIAVIPQDPFLFSGTVRDNLDPFGQYHDEDISKILEELRLKNVIKNLNSKINKAFNLSGGQKQLLCVTRALLEKKRIVILDEITADVDLNTANLLLQIVHSRFVECTVILITHRQLSLLKCDKVIVFSQGRIVEFDEPTKLLQDRNSFLHCMVI